jgi:hypothetical protein
MAEGIVAVWYNNADLALHPQITQVKLSMRK